jgi:hypothetical protein
MDNEGNNEDYSFMRSGFDNLNHGEDIDYKQQIASTLVCFSENAMMNAATYVKHAKRNIITKEDLQRCFKLETFIFAKRENLEEKIRDIQDEIYGESDEENEIIYDDDEVEPDAFSESTCTCFLCQCLNNVDLKWNTWVPETPMQIVLKRHIDAM